MGHLILTKSKNRRQISLGLCFKQAFGSTRQTERSGKNLHTNNPNRVRSGATILHPSLQKPQFTCASILSWPHIRFMQILLDHRQGGWCYKCERAQNWNGGNRGSPGRAPCMCRSCSGWVSHAACPTILLVRLPVIWATLESGKKYSGKIK
jgi:hypothetical protein